MFFSWLDSLSLAIESNDVIALRLIKMSSGGRDACDEAILMVTEKVKAAVEAGTTLWTGGTPAAVVQRYREHVASNAQRLR